VKADIHLSVRNAIQAEYENGFEVHCEVCHANNRTCPQLKYTNVMHMERIEWEIPAHMKYLMLSVGVLQRNDHGQLKLLEGALSLSQNDLNNFTLPNNGIQFEVVAIAFNQPNIIDNSGHYYTLVKHKSKWINLECLLPGPHRTEKVDARSFDTNIDFATLKHGSDAYAQMILLKRM
jgi:hypothetical protein